MFLNCYDASEPPGNLACRIGAKEGIDYMYQVEQWVIDTRNDQGIDGHIVRWELIEGTSNAPGMLIRQWERQPDGTVKEVHLTTGPYAMN